MTERQLILTGLAATSFAVSLIFINILPAAATGLIVLAAGLWITTLTASLRRARETLNLQGKVIKELGKIHQQKQSADVMSYAGAWIGSMVPNQGVFLWTEGAENQAFPLQWDGWETTAGKALEEKRILSFSGDKGPCPLPTGIPALIAVPFNMPANPMVLFVIPKSGVAISRVDRSVLDNIRSHVVLALDNMANRKIYRQRPLAFLQIVLRAMESHDPDLVGHSQRVAHISRLIGANFGLSAEELEVVQYGAFLHDIGKFLVHPEGQEVDHATLGAAFLPEEGFCAEVREAIRHHHERYDGSGYPSGLGYNEIPLTSRIIAVADLYDALTCLAPEQARMSSSRAVAVLKKSIGSSLDPLVFVAFEEIAGQLNGTEGYDDKDNSPVQ